MGGQDVSDFVSEQLLMDLAGDGTDARKRMVARQVNGYCATMCVAFVLMCVAFALSLVLGFQHAHCVPTGDRM